MTDAWREQYVRRFPPASATYADSDTRFAARLSRLKKQTQGSEPFEFDDVMEHAFTPAPDEMFIDNSVVEHDGKLWFFHIVGNPEHLEREDPRIRKLKYEYGGYSTGPSPFQLTYHGHVKTAPVESWEFVATWCPAHVVPFRDGYICVYTGVGLEGTRIGAAFSNNLLDWEAHPSNPLLQPPSWAEPFGPCKDVHVLSHEGVWHIYYSVKTLQGYSAIALATTTDFETFVYADQPVHLDSYSLRGTTGIESSCIVERNGIFHLFYCNGQGTWHMVSDNARHWRPDHGKYVVGPFVAPEVFVWKGEWWLFSTKKEELRRLDRKRGISHHGDVEDERRNLAGMYLAHIRWEGDFPVLEKPSEFFARRPEFDARH